MKRTNTTDAVTTTSVILFVIAVADGKYATGFDWFIRAVCVYPFAFLAWRTHRQRKQG